MDVRIHKKINEKKFFGLRGALFCSCFRVVSLETWFVELLIVIYMAGEFYKDKLKVAKSSCGRIFAFCIFNFFYLVTTFFIYPVFIFVPPINCNFNACCAIGDICLDHHILWLTKKYYNEASDISSSYYETIIMYCNYVNYYIDKKIKK